LTPEEEGDLLGHKGEEASGMLHHLHDELLLTGRISMARVHIAENVFDGVLPLLGVLLAGIIAYGMEGSFIVFEAIFLAALGTSIAHFISGVSGAYLAETAEGKQLIEELERASESRFPHSVIVRVERETTVALSAIKGIVPAGSVLLTISPMFLALGGIIGHFESFFASIGMGFMLLFILGLFLGKTAKTNVWIMALKTLTAGILTCIVLIAVSYFTGY
jgi:predicted membrane protein (TIGR00267 family)